MLCCYLNVFVFVFIIDLKEYSFISMAYINECIDVNIPLKIPSNLRIVWIGLISFQEISYTASPRLYLDIFFKIDAQV